MLPANLHFANYSPARAIGYRFLVIISLAAFFSIEALAN